MNIWRKGIIIKINRHWIARSLSWILFIIFSSHLTLAAEDENQKHLVLVTPGPKTNLDIQRAMAVYGEALRKLDYSLEIRRCEPMLCTLLANRGEVDGELVRSAMYQSFVPNLIKLEESGLSIRWSAYSVDKQLRLQSWQHIRDSGLKVVYLAGLPYLERKLSGGNAGTQFIKVRHWTLGLDKLKKGSGDIYVGSEEIIAAFLGGSGYEGIYRAGVIGTIPLYLFLNKKHDQLAAELSIIITRMKEQGQIDKIHQTIRLEKGLD